MGGTRRLVIAGLGFLAASVAAAGSAIAADAQVNLTIYKAGFVVGGSGGGGELVFDGVTYPLSIGGVSLGLTIGASRADLSGTARGLTKPGDIAGTYTQVQGSAVAAGGGSVVILRKGDVELNLSGRDVGLLASVDLSGIIISLKE